MGPESSSSEKDFWPTTISCGDVVGVVSASDIVGRSKEEYACAALLIFETTACRETEADRVDREKAACVRKLAALAFH